MLRTDTSRMCVVTNFPVLSSSLYLYRSAIYSGPQEQSSLRVSDALRRPPPVGLCLGRQVTETFGAQMCYVWVST